MPTNHLRDVSFANASFQTEGNNIPFALGELLVAHLGPFSARNKDLKSTSALPFFEFVFALTS
jgi:hypothetical protein